VCQILLQSLIRPAVSLFLRPCLLFLQDGPQVLRGPQPLLPRRVERIHNIRHAPDHSAYHDDCERLHVHVQLQQGVKAISHAEKAGEHGGEREVLGVDQAGQGSGDESHNHCLACLRAGVWVLNV
jgi:hypothetical protein